jgi:hypothetical protein
VCNGKGNVAKTKCAHCRGTKVETGESKILIVIEKGMPDRHRMVFEQESDQVPNMIPGDLIFTLVTLPHNRFRREGDNLHTVLRITLLEVRALSCAIDACQSLTHSLTRSRIDFFSLVVMISFRHWLVSKRQSSTSTSHSSRWFALMSPSTDTSR